MVNALCLLLLGEGLPAFAPGAQVELEGPGVPKLTVQVPVVFGNVLGVENAVLIFGRVLFREVVADKVGVYGTVDHDVGDVDVHRSQFSGHALGQGANAVFGAGERCKPCRSTHASGGAGKQDRSPLACGHALGHFASVEEPRETGHFPDLEILAGGFFENAARHIGADIEHECFDVADLGFDLLDQRNHVLFLARVTGETVSFATTGLDGIHQRLEFVGAASGDAGDKTFLRKAFGNSATGSIPSADNQYDLLVIHG